MISLITYTFLQGQKLELGNSGVLFLESENDVKVDSIYNIHNVIETISLDSNWLDSMGYPYSENHKYRIEKALALYYEPMLDREKEVEVKADSVYLIEHSMYNISIPCPDNYQGCSVYHTEPYWETYLVIRMKDKEPMYRNIALITNFNVPRKY